jgi:hypothetical protein
VGEEREVEENGGEEREGKEMDGCPLTGSRRRRIVVIRVVGEGIGWWWWLGVREHKVVIAVVCARVAVVGRLGWWWWSNTTQKLWPRQDDNLSRENKTK